MNYLFNSILDINISILFNYYLIIKGSNKIIIKKIKTNI